MVIAPAEAFGANKTIQNASQMYNNEISNTNTFVHTNIRDRNKTRFCWTDCKLIQTMCKSLQSFFPYNKFVTLNMTLK